VRTLLRATLPNSSVPFRTGGVYISSIRTISSDRSDVFNYATWGTNERYYCDGRDATDSWCWSSQSPSRFSSGRGCCCSPSVLRRQRSRANSLLRRPRRTTIRMRPPERLRPPTPSCSRSLPSPSPTPTAAATGRPNACSEYHRMPRDRSPTSRSPGNGHNSHRFLSRESEARSKGRLERRSTDGRRPPQWTSRHIRRTARCFPMRGTSQTLRPSSGSGRPVRSCSEASRTSVLTRSSPARGQRSSRRFYSSSPEWNSC